MTALTEEPENEKVIPWHPLHDVADIDVLIKEIGDAKIVLLGESTHGTHEFYEWREVITKRLITEKGFDFVAVEGDWDDSYKVNQFVKGPLKDSSQVIELLKQYDRWPASIWSNVEISSLVQWLNENNQQKPPQDKTGFYGLDVYSFWEWTSKEILTEDPILQKSISTIKNIFSQYGKDALKYATAVRQAGADHSAASKKLYTDVQQYLSKQKLKDENSFLLEQQALLTFNGEKYFRTMYADRVSSWNTRDAHMAQTISNLLALHGENAKAVVWVHNGHAGDARYSNMGGSGYTSVGEILRKQFGRDKIFSAAFGTNRGTVLAGLNWYSTVQEQNVLPAKEGSWEHLLHKINNENKIILSREVQENKSLNNWIEFRSIGAVYQGAAVYGRSVIPQRYDAFIYIDSTTALHPILNK